MSTTIETFGSTRLVQDGSFYFLYSTDGMPVELMYGGAPVVAGQFGQIAPIGAEQTATGYEVAWQVSGADQYSVWITDNEGHYLSNTLTRVSGTSAGLESIETSFHQDLNGDGTVGLPESPPPSDTPSNPTVVESFGSTSLTEAVTHFYLYGSNGMGPSLKYQGTDYVDGQFGSITPIGAEQTATGYEVAWKVPGADQYSVWATDNNGNYVSNILRSVPGSTPALKSIEPSFHQDLNGDGAIGSGTPSSPPPASDRTVIESFGSTSLTKIGTQFDLFGSDGTGPSLKYQGADYVDGQFGSITPIGAEQTATGYEVAWKVPGADQYSVWITDSNGNYIANALSNVSGTSPALQSIEASFHQDLNGDGTISGTNQTSSPQFVYQGLDADGAQLYSITWGSSGLQPIEVRVLVPEHPAENMEHSFLYALPVEAGLAQSTWGDGLEQLQQLDVEDKYNATIIEPLFPIESWYADSPTDPTINYETFMSTLLPAWVDSNFATSNTEDNFLIGFSKSGYGALDLLFKHPDVFDAAAAWDFPADMTSYTDYGASANYGTDANFQNNYRLTGTFIDTWKAPFTTEDRIWISGYDVFQSDVADFDALLTSHGVLHTLSTQTFDAHNWYSGWLSGAVAGLYGLVDGGTSGPPPSTIVVENFGSTRLTEVSTHFYLYDSSGSGPSLKYQGADYVDGQFGSITPIAAEQTATGYEVAWKLPGSDQYSVWLTDSGGNYLSNAFTNVPGASGVLQSIETSFHQDLNGDGTIGPPQSGPTVVESFGSTSLTEVGTHFYLYDGSGSGPSLKYQGADYVDGQFGSITPIAAEQTATGYEVAWKLPGADQYSVWLTDSGGNYLSNSLTSVSGADAALQSIETSFHQDLNGDGTIGPAQSGPTVVESFGSTSLTEVGTHFYLYDGSGSGPSLKYQGADYVDGQFGSITPIAAEQTATGYEVAWKLPGADQYSVWLTDSSGNYLSNALTNMSGASGVLQSIETSFHQDLNGDGTIGPAQSGPTVVESFGSTHLTEAGTHFYLYDSSGSGPSLKYQGADYVDGQFGSITPIAAEQTATGYEVAWKLPGADQYSVWLTDSGGNYLSNSLTSVPGADAALQSIETSFHQDLNGDGYQGLVLDGRSGGQTLTAGSSPTTLIGGPNDILNGGSSADTFVFLPSFGANTVNNFAPGTDELQFSHSIFADTNAALSAARQVGSDVVIAHDGSDVVTLHSQQLINLHTANFDIV
jgi:Tryptophan-rich Synechocystis species C-terminal domain/Putative esterase